MIGKVVRNGVARIILASYALTVKEDVFALEIAREVALSDDPRRHVPVERPGSGGCVGLLDPVAIGIIGVRESGRATDPVFRVVVVVRAVVVAHHVAGSVVGVSTLQLIVRGCGQAQVLCRALGWGLTQEVAPGFVVVAIAPVLGMTIRKDHGAVRPGVLRRGQPVERIIGERLVSRLVTVMRDSIDIAVVAIAQVEVIAKVHQLAPTVVAVCRYGPQAAGGHAAGLQAGIVHRRTGDPVKPATLSTHKTRERVVWTVGRPGD